MPHWHDGSGIDLDAWGKQKQEGEIVEGVLCNSFLLHTPDAQCSVCATLLYPRNSASSSDAGLPLSVPGRDSVGRLESACERMSAGTQPKRSIRERRSQTGACERVSIPSGIPSKRAFLSGMDHPHHLAPMVNQGRYEQTTADCNGDTRSLVGVLHRTNHGREQTASYGCREGRGSRGSTSATHTWGPHRPSHARRER
jgi:hypothetical protein